METDGRRAEITQTILLLAYTPGVDFRLCNQETLAGQPVRGSEFRERIRLFSRCACYLPRRRFDEQCKTYLRMTRRCSITLLVWTPDPLQQRLQVLAQRSDPAVLARPMRRRQRPIADGNGQQREFQFPDPIQSVASRYVLRIPLDQAALGKRALLLKGYGSSMAVPVCIACLPVRFMPQHDSPQRTALHRVQQQPIYADRHL